MHSFYTVFLRTGVNTPAEGDENTILARIFTGTANNTEKDLTRAATTMRRPYPCVLNPTK